MFSIIIFLVNAHLALAGTPKKVRAIIVDPNTEAVLLSLTRDNKMWGTPGGAIEAGENPKAALYREVQEETGLVATDFSSFHLLMYDEKAHTYVYGLCLRQGTSAVVSSAQDPDKEFSQLAWNKISSMPSNTYQDAKERAKLFFSKNKANQFCVPNHHQKDL